MKKRKITSEKKIQWTNPAEKRAIPYPIKEKHCYKRGTSGEIK
jgi:hypothetical protein